MLCYLCYLDSLKQRKDSDTEEADLFIIITRYTYINFW